MYLGMVSLQEAKEEARNAFQQVKDEAEKASIVQRGGWEGFAQTWATAAYLQVYMLCGLPITD